MSWIAHLGTVFWVCGALSGVVCSVWLGALDLVTRRLPNRVVAWGTGSTLGLLGAASLVRAPDRTGALGMLNLWGMLGGAGALFLLFALLWRVHSAGIGGGDVKVAPLVGGGLGFAGGVGSVALGLTLACVIAAVWGLVLRRNRKRDAAVGTVPFATCLFAGAWVAIGLLS